MEQPKKRDIDNSVIVHDDDSTVDYSRFVFMYSAGCRMSQKLRGSYKNSSVGYERCRRYN